MSAGSQARTRLDEGNDARTSTDGLFETLKNARRRAVLRYLINESETASFRDLVEYVAARENETQPESVSSAQRNRVRTALYQHHLGKLEEHGFITYDKREGTVSLNGNADQVRPYIEVEDEQRTETVNYLFGGAMIAIAALVFWMPALNGLSAVTVAGLGILLLAHTYRTERSKGGKDRGIVASITDRFPIR